MHRRPSPGAAGDLFLASLGFGLVTAAVLAIASVGFTLQFGVTDVLNLAYGAIMIAGAFIAYVVNQAGASVWLGLLVAVAACSPGRCCSTSACTRRSSAGARHRSRWSSCRSA